MSDYFKKRAEILQSVLPKVPRSQLAPELKPRITPPIKAKGLARKERRAWEKGQRNEDKVFVKVVIPFAKALKKNSSKEVLSVSYRQTGHHNPKKGKVNLEDKRGLDFEIKITARPTRGSIVTYVFQWDSKSSQFKVNKYNKRARRRRLPKGVDLKKAILVYKRPTQSIAQEMLDDITSILPKNIVFDQEKILSQFNPVQSL